MTRVDGKRRPNAEERHSSRSNKRHRLFSDPSPSISCSNSFDPILRKHVSNHKRRRLRSRKPHRDWVFSSRDFSNNKDNFVVVSYNILGVENASKHPDLYSKVLPKYLAWDWRKKLIQEEVAHYNASILCFQEVDRFNDMDSSFKKDGFKGVYKARTGEACDGCAIFWKKKMFSLLHHESIEFQSSSLRNNVAQLCVFEINQKALDSSVDAATSVDPSQRRTIVVGNTHVLFNPNRGDIKLGQVRLFLERAYKLSQEWGGIPVIIAGDLNSVPQSAMYRFLASSELNILLHDRRNISGQIECPSQRIKFRSQNESAARPLTYNWTEEELRLATGNEAVPHLRHHLKLCSAYLGVPGSDRTRDNSGEPLATSYHSKFMGTVDYIWHTEELVPVRVLETLPVNTLRRTGGLPSEKWGSDHLALVCELAFVDDSNRT